MLKSTQNSEITNAITLAVFVRSVGMTKSYKIYYLANNRSVIEAYVNSDIFRNKNYILSIYTLIQRSN